MPDLVAATPIDLALVAIAPPRSRAAEARSRFAAAFGAELSGGPRLVRAGDLVVFGSGPDHWIAAAPGGGWDLERRLAAVFGPTALVADQSDARVCLRLAGPGVRTLLEKGCALDLHPRAFPPGSAASTEIALMPAWIWTEDADVFTVAVSRSYAVSFREWLDEAVAAVNA